MPSIYLASLVLGLSWPPGFSDFKPCCSKCLCIDVIAHMCKYLEDNILEIESRDQRVNTATILMGIGKFLSIDATVIYTSINVQCITAPFSFTPANTMLSDFEIITT